MKIRRVRPFSQEHDDYGLPVVLVHNKSLAQLGGRYAWVRISSADQTIFRRARGGGAAPLPADGIGLDYDARLELGLTKERDGDGFVPCEVEIEKASTLDSIRAHWGHPNLEFRVPYQIALVGLVLGIIGLALGAISLIG